MKKTPKLNIKKAIKHPGSFRAIAKKEGGMNKEGKIKSSFIEKEKKSPIKKIRQKANLAATLKKITSKR